MKTTATIFLLLATCLMLGCTGTIRLYPVQGPLAAQTPSPVLVGQLSGSPFSKSGAIFITLPSGETISGKWVIVKRPNADDPTPTAAPSDMAQVWDTIYGQGFYVSRVLGSPIYARALLKSEKGSALNVELYQSVSSDPDHPGKSKGVARDDAGNIYKIAF